MNWATQALHVARKDARFTRWALTVYGALTAVALFHAIGGRTGPGPTPAPDPLAGAVFALVLLGLVLAAVAVQADSPIQGNAFWASRPFAPTAVLGAKLVYCGLCIVCVPLLAEAVGLMRYDAPMALVIATLARSSMIYGLLLLSAVIVAGLTTDVRGFIVGLLVLAVGLLTLRAILPPRIAGPLASAPAALWAVVALAVSLIVLAWLYRRREASRVAWLGAALTVGASMLALSAFPAPAARVVPASLRTAQVRLDAGSAGGAGIPSAAGGRLRVPVRFVVANVPPGVRLGIQIDSAFARLRGGGALRAAPFYAYLPVENARGALPDGFRVYGAHPETGMPATSLMFDSAGVGRESTAIRDVDVFARITVAEAIPLAATTVGKPIATAVRGVRLRVFDDLARGGHTITTVSSALDDPQHPGGGLNIGMAVINDARREGIVVGTQSYGNATDWIVLPGAALTTASARFDIFGQQSGARRMTMTFPGIGTVSEAAPSPIAGSVPDPSWYDAARVVVVQWRPLGSYAVRLTRTLD